MAEFVKPLNPFIVFCQKTIPLAFDESMSYMEAMYALKSFLESQVIPAVNSNAQAVEDLTTLCNQLQEYMEHYFDNLDVQKEIDNKLDEMYANGQLDLLFSKYVNDYVATTNQRITELDEKVNSLNDLTPEVVSNTSAMTDHEKIYLNTSDGYWYYYNGTQFVQGGLYNSDATDTAIRWYLNDVASDGNNLFNPFTCAVGSLITSDGSYDPTNTNYWVTDYIPMNPNTLPFESNYWYVGTLSYNKELLNFYKVIFYDSDKLKVGNLSSPTDTIKINSQTYEDISDFAYYRIQFDKTVVAFNERYKVLLTTSANNLYSGVDLFSNSRFTAIDSDGIKSGSIENSRLSKNIYLNNIYLMLQNEIMPFNPTDFGYGTVQTATGYEIIQNKGRLRTNEIIKIPAGTSITLTNDWDMLAFSYSDNGTFQGRFYENWGKSIFFPVDIRVKFVFKNDVIGNIASYDNILNLISNINIEKSEGNFDYNGERISIRNKYSADGVGLANYGQDSAVYGNNYITFNSNGYYKVYTMNGDLLKNSTALDQVATIAPHANSVCFGTEKYDEDDNYPLLYVNAYNTVGLPHGACYVYRLLDNMTTSLQQTILIDFVNEPIWAGDGSSVRPYGNFVIDTDNNKLYAYVMIDSLNVTRFFKFDLPTLSDGATVRLEESDIEEYFDVPYMYYMQGAAYCNGKIYATAGFTASDNRLHVIDLKDKSQKSVANMPFIGEPESAIVYNDTLYVSSTSKFYKLQF